MQDNLLSFIPGGGTTVLVIALLVLMPLLWRHFLKFFGVIVVPEDKVGLITKKFVLFGANRMLPDGRVIAVNGEAGYQADMLAPGLHFGYWPWQYDIELASFFTVEPGYVGTVEAIDGVAPEEGRIICKRVACDMFQDARKFLTEGGQRGPQVDVIPPGTYRINTRLFNLNKHKQIEIGNGEIGVVEAIDGKPIHGRVLAKHVDCDSFQDGQAFMDHGGERGPQASVVAPGKYRINPFLFKVSLAKVVDIADNKIGVVATKEGRPLPAGAIAGPVVEGHKMYQDADAFCSAGGYKGLQEQVLLAGRYMINPMFATVEQKDMVEVPIAHVGVVISYVGEDGQDVTGEAFTHGNLVARNCKGVWRDPLDPGRYPINPYTQKISVVQTSNIVLNWADGKNESHRLDEKLSTITVRSSDGFTFNLDVSQIIHIPRNDAPLVIARFGSLSELVTQVLEPTIGNYFRNSAQGRDVISFLAERRERQDEAQAAISSALKEYNVVGVDTLIGDIVPPNDLMKTLTDRKIAQQVKETLAIQQQAEIQRKEYEQAAATARTQSSVVDAERSVQIAKFKADAKVHDAEGDATARTINAEADAKVIKMKGDAEAGRISAIGTAEADVINKKIAATGQTNYALMQVSEQLAQSGHRLVPDVVVQGTGEADGASGLVSALLGNMLNDQLKGRGQAAVATAALPAPAGLAKEPA